MRYFYMMLKEKDAQILQHIVRHCDHILDTISYFGEDQSIFLDNHIYQGNISINLEAIGEHARHFSEDFLEQTKEIPWKKIKGQRNIFAHGYDLYVDFATVWDTISQDIPIFRAYCAEILQSNHYEIIKIKSICEQRDPQGGHDGKEN